ncbi:sterol desaturase [Hesseltinella vesiculosa]|uniref:Sterol desaturase n=1 Tax=Hesseltinella vesiculosa TaxID=101127 RepID=A0A1X2GIU9_9FUNG|nr:sterol desaturase [Hesseltinella vesiculosa]
MWCDEMMALWVPIAVYWVVCSFYEVLMRLQLHALEKYRLHSPNDRDRRNKVSFIKVVVMVAVQHMIQFVFGYFLLDVQHPSVREVNHYMAITRTTRRLGAYLGLTNANHIAWLWHHAVVPFIQFFLAMCYIDTHQYFLHRLGHTSKFMYKHFHSLHHRLYVPYAFGALYNHVVEGFMLDTLGAGIAYELTGMSPKMGMTLFTFSNIKTINDHCGYNFPWDPLNLIFKNNGAYHDIHHQPYGIKTNFAQPFFTFWDRLFNTEFDQTAKRSVKPN